MGPLKLQGVAFLLLFFDFQIVCPREGGTVVVVHKRCHIEDEIKILAVNPMKTITIYITLPSSIVGLLIKV